MKPVALIFDFDGVIVDNFEIHLSGWISVFEKEYSVSFRQSVQRY